MLILLVGPKGSGKSHIGRLLETKFGVHFFHVEPHWIAYHADCEREARPQQISEGIARIHPMIRRSLDLNDHVCVETTGASPEILGDLMSIGTDYGLLCVSVTAPLSICLERIKSRPSEHQIPVSEEVVTRIHELSGEVRLAFDIVLENLKLTDAEILRAFDGFALTGESR